MMFRKRPDLEERVERAALETENETQAENPFYEAAEALAEMEQNGMLPEGFTLSEAASDRAFAALLTEFPPEAAVRIYAAERRADRAEETARAELQETVRVRNALPKSTRADRAVAATPDYMAMSNDAFRALEQQYRNAARSGKRVHI